MTKKELLLEIERLELARLDSLSYDELSKEASEWFNDEALPSETREEITEDYLTDFMVYRRHESEQELLDYLKNY